jgi:hypothetical protein
MGTHNRTARTVIEMGGATAALTLLHPAVVLVIGNLLDAVFTLSFLQLGLVGEANPLMRWAYDGSPVWFVLSKVALVELGVLLLWLHRETPIARLAMHAAATLYTGVVGYHLSLLKVLPAALAQ